MKLRAALKSHEGSFATNASPTTLIRVTQLWSYQAGLWRETYTIAGIAPESGEVLWQQDCRDLQDVEQSLAALVRSGSSLPIDEDAWQ